MKKFASYLERFATPLAVLLLAGVILLDRFGASAGPVSPPTVSVNGKALGRSYAPVVASTLGDAWNAAADTLEQGKTVTESQLAFQVSWQAARVKAFSAKVAPEFVKVLPEGQEPTNPAQRAEVVQLWRDFAAGLKGGR